MAQHFLMGVRSLNAVDPTLAGCDAVFLGPRLGFSGTDLSNSGPRDAGGDDQDILLTNTNGDNGYAFTTSSAFTKGFDFDWPAYVGSGRRRI